MWQKMDSPAQPPPSGRSRLEAEFPSEMPARRCLGIKFTVRYRSRRFEPLKRSGPLETLGESRDSRGPQPLPSRRGRRAAADATPHSTPPPARRAGGFRRQVSSGRSRLEARGPRPQWDECAGTGCVIVPPLQSLGANPRIPISLWVSSGGNGSFNPGRERGGPEVTCAPANSRPALRPPLRGGN